MSLTPGEVAVGGSQDLAAVCVEGVARLGLAVFGRGYLWHGPSFGFVFERALTFGVRQTQTRTWGTKPSDTP
jgi:hypothetical protein